jgi:hypothetical protein
VSDLPKQNPDVLFRRVGEDMVLVHMKTNQIYALNETGARFWELFSEGLSRVAIEARLLDEFEVTDVQLRGEIDGLLTDLAQQDLVHAE